MTKLEQLKGQAWFQQTLSDLVRHEGFKEYAYPDPLSKLGKADPLFKKYGWGSKPASVIIAQYGFSIEDGKPWTVGIGYTQGININSRMSLEFAKQKLAGELYEHLPVLNRLLPEWEQYPDVVKTVLANMAFNMGNRLTQFNTSLELLRHRRFSQAGTNLRKTAWYKQTGSRARELCTRLETGVIDPRYKIASMPTKADFSDVVSTVTSTDEIINKD